MMDREKFLGSSPKAENKLHAQAVAICIGIKKNIDLAREAGLTVNKGVVVNGFLQTSDPNVFAAGDVAEFLTKQHNNIRL